MILALHNIPMSDFKKWMVEGDTTVLGDDPEAVILEYRDKSMDTSEETLVLEEGKMLRAAIDLEKTDILCKALLDYYDNDLAKELMKIYPNVEVKASNLEQAIAKINELKNRYVSTIEEAKQNIENAMKNYGKMTYDHITDLFVAISKMQGYHVPESIDALMFVRLRSKLIQQSKNVETESR